MVSDYGSTSFNLINMSSQCNFFSSLAQHPSTVVLTSMFMNACSTLILLRRGGNVPECSFVFVCVQCLCVNKITHLNKLCINIHENFGRGTCNVHLGTSKMDQILFGMKHLLSYPYLDILCILRLFAICNLAALHYYCSLDVSSTIIYLFIYELTVEEK